MLGIIYSRLFFTFRRVIRSRETPGTYSFDKELFFNALLTRLSNFRNCSLDKRIFLRLRSNFSLFIHCSVTSRANLAKYYSPVAISTGHTQHLGQSFFILPCLHFPERNFSSLPSIFFPLRTFISAFSLECILVFFAIVILCAEFFLRLLPFVIDLSFVTLDQVINFFLSFLFLHRFLVRCHMYFIILLMVVWEHLIKRAMPRVPPMFPAVSPAMVE